MVCMVHKPALVPGNRWRSEIKFNVLDLIYFQLFLKWFRKIVLFHVHHFSTYKLTRNKRLLRFGCMSWIHSSPAFSLQLRYQREWRLERELNNIKHKSVWTFNLYTFFDNFEQLLWSRFVIWVGQEHRLNSKIKILSVNACMEQERTVS